MAPVVGAVGRILPSAARSATRADREEAFLRALRHRQATQGRRGLRRRPPKAIPPDSVEREYARALLAMVQAFNDDVRRILLDRLPSIGREADLARPDRRADDWPQQLQELVATLRVRAQQRTAEAEATAREYGERTADWNRAQWRRQINSVLGVDVLAREPWLTDQLQSFAAENAALIRSIPEQQLTQVEGIAQRGMRSGTRPEEIARDLEKRFEVARSRARLIARDQVAKLNGQLTQLRQTNIGVTEYIWSTSRDERVRPSHAAKEGKKFRWDDPPADTGHPGEDYQCRCTALPVLDDVIDEFTG